MNSLLNPSEITDAEIAALLREIDTSIEETAYPKKLMDESEELFEKSEPNAKPLNASLSISQPKKAPISFLTLFFILISSFCFGVGGAACFFFFQFQPTLHALQDEVFSLKTLTIQMIDEQQKITTLLENFPKETLSPPPPAEDFPPSNEMIEPISPPSVLDFSVA